jgi:hypothetical protein
MTQTPTYRYIGLTDECVECQRCGKTELRNTVVLAILDADGNPEAITYYGSTCAARALAVKGGGRAVLKSARWAHDALRLNVKDSRARLDFYGMPHSGEPTAEQVAAALPRFAEAHARAVWAPATTRARWEEMIRETIAHHQSVVRDAACIGL